ncbi:MAG TPA: sensor histidine kinase [Ornithinibacter sp.]|nr:sensor histidine kinase [Ornithinibacter sp.]
MSTLAEMLRDTTALAPAESEWLHLLAGDWQLISDLSFADLVLWVRGGMDGWRAVAHVRPNTGPMVFYDDIVGSSSSRSRASMLDEAARSRRLVAKPMPTIREDMSIREDAVPVVRGGRAIAVVTRHANLTGGRTPSRLELTYRDLAESIMRMVAAGDFPSTSAPTGMRRGAPRVGDGVIHLDAEGLVKYASPNAVSAVHRMGHVGDVIDEMLAQIVTDLVSRSGANVDESLAVVATGRAAWRSEVETESATITMRAIPLMLGGVRTGAMVLMRDVSELRRREQELLTKDATIREIHHRVKNNLQTVAALLRLQARRVTDDAARASLEEAVRRVGTIALVHETLSQGFDETVNFDEIAVRGLRAVVEVATREHQVESTFTGSFGRMRAEDATALAMIISELVQNAVEHGLEDRDGKVEVAVTRRTLDGGEEQLTVVITDDGVGLPAGFRPVLAGLGTRIVTSLAADLKGRIRWENNEPRGTRVEFVCRLRPLR